MKNKILSKETLHDNLNKQLENLIQMEDDAIANNNFEEAQTIENSVSETKLKLKKTQDDIEECKKEMLTFREQELLIIRGKWKILEEVCNAYTKSKSSQEFELETFQNTDMNRHRNENIKIKKLREKLDFLQTNLDTDKTYIDTEEEKITKLIKSQSSGVFEELDELNVSKNTILLEIEELKRQLDIKYTELDNLNKSIEVKEIEIDTIKSNFNHEFNKLNFKKKNYEESLRDFQIQEVEHQKMIKKYDEDENNFNNKILNFKTHLSKLEEELADFKNKTNENFENLNKKEFLLKNENEIMSKIHLIDLKHNKTNCLKEKNIEEIQSLNLQIKKLQAEILGWDMKLPSLEEEKKGFVVLKNFKEAGRVSNEIKSLNENKNKNLGKCDENKNKILSLENENESIVQELEKIKETKLIEEKELNLTKYEYLLYYKEHLLNLICSTKEKGLSVEYLGDEV